MRIIYDFEKQISFPGILFFLCLCFFSFIQTVWGAQPVNSDKPSVGPYEKSEIDLAAIPYKIIHETYRETDGKENWELFLMNADGSNSINLTQTPEIDELYPHASPDGTKICFVADEGTSRRDKVRSVYYMNIDGTNRVKVAKNTRQPCWSPDGKTIAYAKCEFERYSTRDYSSQGLFFYNIESGEHKQHPYDGLKHLYNICWSPDGEWLIATVIGGMGYEHSNIAIEKTGTKIFDLELPGCRPDVTSDGKRIVYCPDERVLWIADLDLTLSIPRVANRRVVFAASGINIYQQQADWSPDGKFIAFSRGPQAGGKGLYPVAPANPAEGWDICVGTINGKWVQVTTDGKHNKEPDWVPISKSDL